MIKVRYKPGEYISSSRNKNNYHQCSLFGKLRVKGYFKNNKYIGYSEVYRVWDNKGLNYIL